uniref:Uncharacterized protein n=1 Tax=Rhizophora mucronata TaxID=61149 RepID=A0A2P2N9U1_RHIMU
MYCSIVRGSSRALILQFSLDLYPLDNLL